MLTLMVIIVALCPYLAYYNNVGSRLPRAFKPTLRTSKTSSKNLAEWDWDLSSPKLASLSRQLGIRSDCFHSRQGPGLEKGGVLFGFSVAS
jgi:hypothetical protein